MISSEQFDGIKKQKELGRNPNQTAKRLGITYPTVRKYWSMDERQFDELKKRETRQKKQSKCDIYRDEIISLLKDVPERSSANIYDRLLEHHPEVRENITERQVRRYVSKVRKEEEIPKMTRRPRDYQAVGNLSPGQQVQIDFGSIKVRRADDPTKRITLTFILFTLKYSRFKYVQWTEGSFSAEEAVQAHLNAFEYFGGIPRELVYDQDKRFITREVNGYLEYTAAYQAFLDYMPVEVFGANKADPETKGTVENYVKFVKNNFARGRLFVDIETWQKECLSWLERSGNGKVCQATNKTPAALFLEEEQQALSPYIRTKINIFYHPMITYSVLKDNTISVGKSRYRVPKGTYNNSEDHKVLVQKNKDTLRIYDYQSGELLIEHPINHGTPDIVGEREPKHLSDKDRDFLSLFFAHLMDYRNGLKFAEDVCAEYPRHYVKQLREINLLMWKNRNLDKQVFEQAFTFCLKEGKLAAPQFEEALKSFESDNSSYYFETEESGEPAWRFSNEELTDLEFISKVIQINKKESFDERAIRLSAWIKERDDVTETAGGYEMSPEIEHELMNQNKLKQISQLTLGSLTPEEKEN